MGCTNTKKSAGILKLDQPHASPLVVKNLEDLKMAPANFVFYRTNPIIEDYEMNRKLGSGTFGSVRVGIHRTTRQRRAVKTIKACSLNMDSECKSKFLHEVNVLKGMDHPNIMKIYEFYEEPRHYHIVTELVDGGQLFDFLIESRQLTEPVAAHFLQQILTGVAYIHSKGIVHRDLKPENLILKENSADSALKLIDFGTSALLGRSKKLVQKLGTAYYIAPEVLGGEYDNKCDIWSCGVILYIMLCGSPPFIGEDTLAILEQVARGTYSLKGSSWKKVSSEAKDLVQQLLEFNPNSRPTALDVLQHPWFHKSPASSGNLESFANLKKFRAGVKLQQAVMTFIVAQLTIQEDSEELAGAFTQLDVNKDGRLSREELQEGYRVTLHCNLDVECVMSEVDADGNGYVEYSEFLVAAMKREIVASKQNLENAFKLFDADGDGKINSDELRGLLGTNVISADETWTKLISQVDQDGDGQIDLSEFKEMVLKVF